MGNGRLLTYSEYNINSVHQTKDGIADFGLMITVACEHENAGDDMMSKHLPMVLSPLFNVNDDDLLYPECKLYEVVPFEQAAHLPVRPVGPKLAQVKPVFRVVHDILATRQLGILPQDIAPRTMPRDQKVVS